MAKNPRKRKETSVMHTDIRDLEIAKTLRQLGNVRVNDWEFGEFIPKVKEIAATEVDVIDLFKRTANLRVNDWEIGKLLANEPEKTSDKRPPSQEAAQECIRKLSAFLSYIARSLAETAEKPTIKVSTPSPSEIRFRLILNPRDTVALIGHGGHTAAAIRNLLKETGSRSRFIVDLKILNHEEEKSLQKNQPTRAPWRKVKDTAQ